jgi:hypothetical protein
MSTIPAIALLVLIFLAANSEAQQASAQITIRCSLTQEAGFLLDPATLPPEMAEALNLTHRCHDITEAMHLLAAHGFDVGHDGIVTANGSRWLIVEIRDVRQSRDEKEASEKVPAVTLWRLG